MVGHQIAQLTAGIWPNKLTYLRLLGLARQEMQFILDNIMHRITQSDDQNRRGFTLIELLVVVAIIAILASMLLPVLSKARASTRKTAVVNNMKQMALGYTLYADDNSECLLPSPAWRTGFVAALFAFNERPLFDQRLVARAYNFAQNTDHPYMGAPPWCDPSGATRNVSATTNYSIYSYNPGYVYAAAAAPLRVPRAKPDTCLMQELVMDEGADPVPCMRSVYLNSATVPRPGNSSAQGSSFR